MKKHWKLITVLAVVLLIVLAALGYEAYERMEPEFTFIPAELNEEEQLLYGDFMIKLGWQHRAERTVQVNLDGDENLLSYAGDRVYTGRVALPLDDERHIVSIFLFQDGKEPKGLFLRDQYGLLPVDRGGCSFVMPEYAGGVLDLKNSFGFTARGLGTKGGRPVDLPEFRFYRNGELIHQLTGVRQETGSYCEYNTEGAEDVRIPCKEGDEVKITFSCADEFGLAYEFELVAYSITADGPEENVLRPVAPMLSWKK